MQWSFHLTPGSNLANESIPQHVSLRFYFTGVKTSLWHWHFFKSSVCVGRESGIEGSTVVDKCFKALIEELALMWLYPTKQRVLCWDHISEYSAVNRLQFILQELFSTVSTKTLWTSWVRFYCRTVPNEQPAERTVHIETKDRLGSDAALSC